jgi:predicted DNA-binding protein (UPF0278 family)
MLSGPPVRYSSSTCLVVTPRPAYRPRARGGVLPSDVDVDDLLVLSMMEGIVASRDPQDVPAARQRLLVLLRLR